MAEKILVVKDDRNLLDTLKYNLRNDDRARCNMAQIVCSVPLGQTDE